MQRGTHLYSEVTAVWSDISTFPDVSLGTGRQADEVRSLDRLWCGWLGCCDSIGPKKLQLSSYVAPMNGRKWMLKITVVVRFFPILIIGEVIIIIITPLNSPLISVVLPRKIVTVSQLAPDDEK